MTAEERKAQDERELHEAIRRAREAWERWRVRTPPRQPGLFEGDDLRRQP